MHPSVLRWYFIAILIILAAVIPWRGAARVRDLLTRDRIASTERIAIYASTIAFQWVLAGVTVWRCLAGRWTLPMMGLILDQPKMQVFLGLIGSGLFGIWQVASIRHIMKVPVPARGRLYEVTRRILPHNDLEALIFVALVCTVSACEEFLYRGFAYTIFFSLFNGSTAAAIVLSSLLFGFGHTYQGRRGVVTSSILGLVLAGLRAWSGSLVPAVFVHFTVDLIAGLYGMRVFGAEAAQNQPSEGNLKA